MRNMVAPFDEDDYDIIYDRMKRQPKSPQQFLYGGEMRKINDTYWNTLKKDIYEKADEKLSKQLVINIEDPQKIVLQVGSIIYELKPTSQTSIEDSFKKEFQQKYETQYNRVVTSLRSDFASKIKQVDDFVADVIKLSEESKREIERIRRESQPMPVISYDLAKRGLTVSKGNEMQQFYWFFRAVYSPKFVDRKMLKTRFIKQMVTPIIILIETKEDRVYSVTTRRLDNLNYFSHYHQASPDCWGSWSIPRNWSTPEDIYKIGIGAQNILENINSDSVANREPRGLPRLSTLLRNLELEDKEMSSKDLGKDSQRMTGNALNSGWSTMPF
jgi:hypothetical protein